MDSEALETFVTVHRAGGVSSAAERLHRSQPAISRRIALLEERLGAPLFERVSGGLALSEVGQTLLPHAERVLACLKDAAAAVAELQSGTAGAVSVAVVGTLADAKLAAILKRFATAHPKVMVALRTATSAEVSEQVRSGECTIGLRYFDDPSPDLTCHALTPEKLVVACAGDRPPARRRVRTLLALRSEPWLAFPQRPARREIAGVNIVAQFQTRGVAEFDWTPVDSLSAQKRLIEAGFGLALLPQSGIAEELARKSIATISVGDLRAVNPVSAIVRRGGYLSTASRAFLDLLVAKF
jgi:DNA-binding transcriptional LysR family regulator